MLTLAVSEWQTWCGGALLQLGLLNGSIASVPLPAPSAYRHAYGHLQQAHLTVLLPSVFSQANIKKPNCCLSNYVLTLLMQSQLRRP